MLHDASSLAALQCQTVREHRNELRIRGLSLGDTHGIAEVLLQRLQIAPIPCHLDGVADCVPVGTQEKLCCIKTDLSLSLPR